MDDQVEDSEKKQIKKLNGSLEKFKSLIEENLKNNTTLKVALFTHAYPDPDAIGSIMAMEWMLKKMYDIDCLSFYQGEISHPQNKTLFNLLEPNMVSITQYKPQDFNFRILLDTIPNNSAPIAEKFDVVIDHHRDSPMNYDGLYINLKAGSCAATVYHLIKKLNLSFDHENEIDKKVATAIVVGIMTDCDNLMSEDTTSYETSVVTDLLEYKNSRAMKQIVNYERPKFWINTQAEAISRNVSKEGISVIGLGIIPGEHRDMIADMAQQMSCWEAVHTAVAFAIVDGDKIVGCIRSDLASISVPALCRQLGEDKQGKGGGKLGKGAYQYNFGSMEIDDDLDEKLREETWNLACKREIGRIFKLLNR